jgi:acetyltransferase
MLASATPETYIVCLKTLLEDNNVDGVVILLPPPPMYKTEDMAEAIIPIIHRSGKPTVIALMGSELTANALVRFNAENIPTYPFPERAVSALGALVRRAEYINHEGYEEAYEGAQREKLLTINHVHQDIAIDELMTDYGIQTAPLKLACNADEAMTIAESLGFPVVMKIASPDILHKSDAGGVLLNVASLSQVNAGYAQMIRHIQSVKPEAQIEGIYIQRQIPPGQEVIAGMVRDPQFGPLMMFGSGGVEVEGLKDVAFALAPLNQVEVREMMRKTWAGRKLKGFRSIPPADEESVIDVLIKLSRLATKMNQSKRSRSTRCVY